MTRSRVKRLPCPVLTPLRLSTPAITSSRAISASARTASTTSAGVLVRWPRRRRGRRCSVWAPPTQCSVSTISARASSRSATASWRTVRTIRFLSRASVVGADQIPRRSAASVSSAAGARAGRGVAASCSAMRASQAPTRARARFQRASSSPVTRRFSGSAASYCRKARSAAKRAASRSRTMAARASSRRVFACASAARAASTAAGCTTDRSADSTTSSTRRPPKAMQFGSP
ncbi:conserved hypothetical protein [Methylobacterium nodulans ORS 2060]|uniref:Uncharacterized protein n=1 Tax=Methylobacterium nodulans (strain LMG 21967 / CNCM I-2342 / ORS 2060) TaxID=460265 RepID=B8IAY8_METNO|nr:conserved hypothetical protein [Methylobacterium nodulans ORS 2060]